MIFVSIIVRFGIIEAFLRYYFSDEDQARRDALARRAVVFLLLTSTLAAVVAGAGRRTALASSCSATRTPTTFLIAVLGLWAFTNLELAYGLLRVDERLRTYATASLINVALTIVASVVLVVGFKQGARGLLIGNYGASTVVLLGAVVDDAPPAGAARAPAASDLPTLLRFGLPTVPAEASVYALSIVDRYYIYHDRSPRLRGPVLDRRQARGRGRVHRARVPVRLAAARVLGQR